MNEDLVCSKVGCTAPVQTNVRTVLYCDKHYTEYVKELAASVATEVVKGVAPVLQSGAAIYGGKHVDCDCSECLPPTY